jgi:hypothetical protein
MCLAAAGGGAFGHKSTPFLPQARRAGPQPSSGASTYRICGVAATWIGLPAASVGAPAA